MILAPGSDAGGFLRGGDDGISMVLGVFDLEFGLSSIYIEFLFDLILILAKIPSFCPIFKPKFLYTKKSDL